MNVKLESRRGIQENQGPGRLWETVAVVGLKFTGAEEFRKRVSGAKEPAVGVLNSFLMVTDPGGGKRSPAWDA